MRSWKGDRIRRAHRARLAVAALALVLASPLAGCGRTASLRALLPPQLLGFERVSDELWVEPGTPAATRTKLRLGLDTARRRVESYYGPLESRPRVLACRTRAAAGALGLYARNAHVGAHVVAGRVIVVGPRSLDAGVLTHEWAHAELLARLHPGHGRVSFVPRWFDEGLACVIGEEARYSEPHWQEIVRRGAPVPNLGELMTFRQIEAAVEHYGDTRPDSAGNLHVVYSAAAHEVRGWLARVGPRGLLSLIAAMRDGESFWSAYARIGRAEGIHGQFGPAFRKVGSDS